MSDGVQTEDLSVEETQTGGLEFQGSVETQADPMKRAAVPAPNGVPEKFWDGEKGALRTDALLKSYSELEKQLGAKDGDEGADEGADDEADEGADTVADAGSDEGSDEETNEGADEGADGENSEATPMQKAVEAAQAHYAEHGELSEEVVENLVSVGYTHQQISLYMAGVKAQEAALVDIAEKAAGSLEDYQKAKLWAAEAWTEKQITAFDAQIADLETAKVAAAGLMAAYREANPGEGTLQNLNSGANKGSVYSSMEEYDKDLEKAGNSREKRRAAVEKYRRSLKSGSIKPNRDQPFGR